MLHSGENSGYVYLVHAVGTNRYKIGRTKDPQRRLEQLKQQSPFPVKVLEIYYADDYLAEESRLHRVASKYRTHGEWFELPAWWLEHVHEWFYNSKCHRYIQVSSQSQIISYKRREEVSKASSTLKFYPSEPLLAPSTRKQMERAIELLGHCVRGSVLTSEVSVQAASWKATIKQMLKTSKSQSQKSLGWEAN